MQLREDAIRNPEHDARQLHRNQSRIIYARHIHFRTTIGSNSAYPLLRGSRPDALRFMLLSACLSLLGVGIYYVYGPDATAIYASTKVIFLGMFMLVTFGTTLFCRVELGDDQIRCKRLLGSKVLLLSDIRSAGYDSLPAYARLVIRTENNSMVLTSLSFSAHQLNVIRNYCDRFRATD